MKKIIVTTTINSPTIATRKFAEFTDWQFIVVGDTATPHKEYEAIPGITYLHPDYQHSEYKDISELLGWKTIQRRNIGFLEARKLGADIIATVDDDNIPYDDWGQNVCIGKEVECDLWETINLPTFDPLSVTNNKSVWHRGYPIEFVPQRHNVQYKGKIKKTPHVQADLWDGDPDIDALARLSQKPIVKFDKLHAPYCSNTISPFNSQNTFLSKEVLPYYAMLPHCGRMDDIWASYILQFKFPGCVVYNSASVYQERNKQDLITNLEKEVIGYRNTFELIVLADYKSLLPHKATEFYEKYVEAMLAI